MSISMNTEYNNYIYQSPHTRDRQESGSSGSAVETREHVDLSEAARYYIPDIGNDNRGNRVFFSNNGRTSAYSVLSVTTHVGGTIASPGRNDWDGISQEKPESFSHVPDKLWNAMVESYDEGEAMGYASLFDMPKWEVGFDRQPPVLNKFDVDDEKMLSYDYISVIDEIISHSGMVVPEKITDESIKEAMERSREQVALLTRLKENISSVLEPPLYSNSDMKSDFNAFNTIYSDMGDGMLEERFIAYTAKYESVMRWNAVETAAEGNNIPEDHRPQLREAVDGDPEIDTASKAFTDYLLKTNSNLYDDVEVSPEISEEWYTKFLAEHIAKVLDEMGPIGSAGSKWKVPILWEIEKDKAAQQG